MKEIKLTQGKVALVDDEDFEKLNQYKWFVHHSGERWYALRSASTKIQNWRQVQKIIRLHRQIMNPPNNMQVDHKDGDGLNNQRSNLRICTQSQNNANSRLAKNNSIGYKGVHFYGLANKYQARITKDKINYSFGYYHHPEDAALAYDKAAHELFGEFAKTNFINCEDWT